MRKTGKAGDLTVQMVAGSYVVLMGLNLPKNKTSKLLGFAVQRTDVQSGEVIWMRGMKTFAATDPKDNIGQNFSSRDHPFQTFQWADYSVKPGSKYKYKIIALRGTPTTLQETETVLISITTESEVNNTHAVFFNRGAAASQEYARRFQNKKPSEIGAPAYNWLSRGLAEAMEEFIAKAKNKTYTLLGAVYEFEYSPILELLKKAKATGASLSIIYHAYDDVTKVENEKAINLAGIGSFCKPRKNTLKIAHNKFFILLRNKKPVEVWTGSTNISENGIFGHSNVGHIVRDAAVAESYYKYWLQLEADVDGPSLKKWMDINNPLPQATDLFPETFPVFSPHKGPAFLNWYSELAGSASAALFMTFAFGMNGSFLKVYDQLDNVLRIALMDKKGTTAASAAEIDRVRRLPNCVVAVGNNIKINAFDRWLAEMYSIIKGPRVPFIHNKFMLVDPLGEMPIVITGSANFSDASTTTNDENMIVIRGNQKVADIYLGEFMRLYSHYAFRESLTFKPDNAVDRSHLIANDSWTLTYYGNTSRSMRRKYFSGVGE